MKILMSIIQTKYLFTPLFALMVSLLFSSSLFAESFSEISDADLKEIKMESKDFVEALDNYTIKQKREAEREIDKAVLALDDNIEGFEETLQQNWNSMSKETRQETREALRDLREQRIEMAELYGSMKTSSGNAWEEMKEGFSDAYEELHEAWVDSEEGFSS